MGRSKNTFKIDKGNPFENFKHQPVALAFIVLVYTNCLFHFRTGL